ncbi:hypothetical protein [Ahrensia kielensis]|uniref:hypothetical protein n=1 Tax=Ahrensia kielensis TaxID=76980 RepID=UPI00036EEC15|nr:hypothetical protein [Ahrensia kielensis]
MKRRIQIISAALASVIAVGTMPAFAEYPERPITLLVPWSAGGGTDVVGRMIATGLQEALGQPVNVVNRAIEIGTRNPSRETIAPSHLNFAFIPLV